ncbi:MAG: fluoride efflux transporter CrcB [Planctomycetaceae bacterium]
MELAVVGTGGFLGAIGRYVVTGLMHRRFPGFLPAGTLAVNLIGCLAIGVLMELVIQQKLSAGPWRLFVVTGLLGSLTTFSAFGYETVELMREEDFRRALWNVTGNVLLGCAAVAAGMAVVRVLAR